MKTLAPALTTFSACLATLAAHAQAPPPDRLETLQRQLAEQSAKLELLQAQLSEQQDVIASLREAVGEEILDQQRGGSANSGMGAATLAATRASISTPVAAVVATREPMATPFSHRLMVTSM